MKISASLSAIVIVLLTACSSDKKDGSSVNAQGSLATGCPTIDGVYTRKIDAENSRSVEVHTKNADGFFHYSFGHDSSFLKADGLDLEMELEGKAGKLKVSCDKDSVTVVAQEEDGPVTSLTYRVLEANQLKIETNGGDVALMDGVYTKE